MDDAYRAQRFLAAVTRQAEIAQWHVDAITRIPIETWMEPTHLADGSVAPSVGAQAHIEGCLHALRNAEDKFYEVLFQFYRLNERDDLSRHQRYEAARERLDEHRPRIAEAFREWSDDFVKDVRSVRNIATYRAEAKRPIEDDWVLQDPGSGTGYRGERKARDYCGAAATKARDLVRILTRFVEVEGNRCH